MGRLLMINYIVVYFLKRRANAQQSSSDLWMHIRNEFFKVSKVFQLFFFPFIQLNCPQKANCTSLIIDNSLHKFASSRNGG